jgi:hypothetical protein
MTTSQDQTPHDPEPSNGVAHTAGVSDAAPTAIPNAVPTAVPNAAAMPHTMPVVAADAETQKLLDRAKARGMTGSMDEEIAAGLASAATGVPMKPDNMAERLATVDPAKIPAGGFFRREAAPVTSTGTGTPQPQAAPAPNLAAEERVRAMIAVLNRARVRPQGFLLPPEEYARRIPLNLTYGDAIPYGEDHLIAPESTIVITARVAEGVVFEIAELRKLQLHPFGLDRLLVSQVAIDGVEIAPMSPAALYARSDAAPMGIVTPSSVLTLRVRNLTKGPAPIALAVVVVPLERAERV